MAHERTTNARPQKQSDEVSSLSTDYLEMQDLGKWDLIADLWAGTQAMRDAAEHWLPRNEAEEIPRYRARLSRSFLFNGFRDAIQKSVAEPLGKPIVLEGLEESNVSDVIKDLNKDVDKSGTNLREFTKDWFQAGEKYGLAHAIIDFSRTPIKLDEEGEPLLDEDGIPVRETFEEEKERGPRPIWILVTPPNLIGWKFDGKELSQIRIKESAIVSTGKFTDERVERIRVYNRTTWELWQQEESADEADVQNFELIDAGINDFGRIPIVTFYTNKLKEMTGLPPFLDVAWLNLAHWQSSSDQRNILRIARIANLAMTGVGDKELKTKTIVGADTVHKFSNPDAKMFFVEHKGTAIKSGQEDLDNLKEEMSILGNSPKLQKAPGTITATEKAIDTSKDESILMAWTRDMEVALTTAYEFSMEWVSDEVPKDFKVQLDKNFTLTGAGSGSIAHLEKAREFKDIDQGTYLTHLKKHDVLDAETNVEETIAKTDKEKQDTANLFTGSDDIPPINDKDIMDNDDDENKEPDLDNIEGSQQ